jgi:hypothetical protein
MECSSHPEAEGAVACPQCGRGVCADCAQAISPSAVCFDCSLAFNRQVRNQVLRGVFVSFVVGLVLAIPAIFLSRGVANGDVAPLVFFYLGFSGYWGRRTVQRVTRRMGGLAVLGGAAATGSGAIGLGGVVFGVVLWVVVGVISGPFECGWRIYQLVRIARVNRGISQAKIAVLAGS